VNQTSTVEQARATETSGAFARYPRNQWYVAAGREEVGRTPFARKLLGKHVVFYRKEDGTPVAMDDHCPHRGYPLSKSRIKGDLIQCGYHGLEFNEHGHCVKIPGRQAAPSALRITSYPLVEKWHWIWIWMGDPARADTSMIPPIDLSDYARYNHRFVDPFPFYGNFMLAHDNLLDATHASYIHAGLLDTDAGKEFGIPPDVSVVGNVVTLTWDHSNVVLPDNVFDQYGLPLAKGTPLNRRTIIQTTPPSCVTNWNQFFVSTPDFSWKNPGAPIGESVHAVGVVPADDNHGYHMLAQSASYTLTEANKVALRQVISQDVAAFEAVQQFYDNNPTAGEVFIGIDKAAVLMRRIIDKMVRDEQLEK
jgi:vanillate monooxygenase